MRLQILEDSVDLSVFSCDLCDTRSEMAPKRQHIPVSLKLMAVAEANVML